MDSWLIYLVNLLKISFELGFKFWWHVHQIQVLCDHTVLSKGENQPILEITHTWSNIMASHSWSCQIKLMFLFPSVICLPGSHCNPDNASFHKSSFLCLSDSRASARRQKALLQLLLLDLFTSRSPRAIKDNCRWRSLSRLEGRVCLMRCAGSRGTKREAATGCQVSHWLPICVWHADHSLLC